MSIKFIFVVLVLTWLAVWWDGNESAHHSRRLLHGRSATHPVIILWSGSHQLSHKNPLQTAIVHAFPQPAATREPEHQHTHCCIFCSTTLCQIYFWSEIFINLILTCKCALWSRSAPERIPPATWRIVPSYHDPSALWSTCLGSGTDNGNHNTFSKRLIWITYLTCT